jgi:hypothetical protein
VESIELAHDHSVDDEVTLPSKYYALNKTITSVDQLWKEWKEGLSGGPAVEALELAGPDWCKSQDGDKRAYETNRRFFRRRRKIIQAVTQLSALLNITEQEAVEKMDMERGPRSLNWLHNNLDSMLDKFRQEIKSEE